MTLKQLQNWCRANSCDVKIKARKATFRVYLEAISHTAMGEAFDLETAMRLSQERFESGKKRWLLGPRRWSTSIAEVVSLHQGAADIG